MRIGVLGAGSWGTALAHHWAEAGHEVILWGRNPEWVEELRRTRENAAYLPGIRLPESLGVTHRLEDLASSEVLAVVVPSHGYRSVLRRCLAVLPKTAGPLTVLSATKGIETESLERMSQVTTDEAGDVGREVDFAVLTGPTFAAELVRGSPTAAVVAAHRSEVAERLREALSSPTFRLYSSTDVVGVELGGTSKNVIAIAAGLVHGLELGHNTVAALLTRGLHEITRLGVACGGLPRTFAGLAGMGDLVLTCTGGLSRNRRLGMALAEGRTPEEISSSTPMVAEGFRNSLAIARLAARHSVEMPITEQMVEILHHGKPPRQAVAELMGRELRSEEEF